MSPTLHEFRVTLPANAPRPHQKLTGLRAYPALTFDAFHELALPLSTKKRTLPTDLAESLYQLGGAPLLVYFRQALRRDGVVLEDGQNPLENVPGSLYPELRAQVERLTPAPSKTLHLDEREARDLVALGFEVEVLESAEATSESNSDDPESEAS